MVADAPTISTCEPFATADDLSCWPADAEKDPDLIELCLQAASDWLSEKLADQFHGVCTTIGLPCPVCHCGALRWVWVLGSWTWWRSRACACGPYPALDLGPDPVVEVTEVTYEGVTIDPSTYRVDGWRYLVRLTDPDTGNPGWPGVNLSAPVEGEHSLVVTWRHGIQTPPLVRLAARRLAHELLAACPGSDGDCALPANVSNLIREGVTLRLNDLIGALNTNPAAIAQLTEVAMALDAYNPHGWTVMPTVHDPDEHPMVYPT